jgi:hypothetical protein
MAMPHQMQQARPPMPTHPHQQQSQGQQPPQQPQQVGIMAKIDLSPLKVAESTNIVPPYGVSSWQ